MHSASLASKTAGGDAVLLMVGGCLGAGVSGDGTTWKLLNLEAGVVDFPIKLHKASRARTRIEPQGSPAVRDVLPASTPIRQRFARGPPPPPHTSLPPLPYYHRPPNFHAFSLSTP